ncbi:hypothetical protein [Polluticaenibacter yanchengensis]|uniref:Uncharacterized protein n=1 Tax=Polluticaenibacter yanchengensis TaxID=3014562 RepID=A0ABT4UNS7_9BACT|nr:hypothetical protein [Chitinophagaceae bacterium LY-5]
MWRYREFWKLMNSRYALSGVAPMALDYINSNFFYHNVVPTGLDLSV